MTYSYTQISQYLSCPRRYKHRYLDGWKEKDTRAAMLFGRAFEQALAAYFQRQDAAAVLYREWSTHRDSGLYYSERDSWDRMLQSGVQLLDHFAQDDRVRIRQPRRNLQVKFTKPLAGQNNFVAYVDAIGELASTARWLRSSATCLALLPASVVVVGFLVVTGFAQQPPQSGAPASDESNIPKPVTDTFERVEMRNAPDNAQVGQKTIEKEDACLLPPLTLVHSPTTVTTALQVPEKAKREYDEACAALKRKKTDSAETNCAKLPGNIPSIPLLESLWARYSRRKGKATKRVARVPKGQPLSPATCLHTCVWRTLLRAKRPGTKCGG